MKNKTGRGFLPLLGLGKRRTSDAERLRENFPFDPAKQLPVIRSSICTGEKVAGVKDLEGGHFTEVMPKARGVEPLPVSAGSSPPIRR